ncbi:MAG: hypothetical protein PHU77_02695 [Simplicispira sp.]|nr:hypothetical protein [Simplicispira sp.]
MKILISLIAVFLLITGCASSEKKDIPMHMVSVGMSKIQVTEKLGNPTRVVSSEFENNVEKQIWLYRQNKEVWTTGDKFWGGVVRNEQVNYLLFFVDGRLLAWKDNDMRNATDKKNIYEIRNR